MPWHASPLTLSTVKQSFAACRKGGCLNWYTYFTFPDYRPLGQSEERQHLTFSFSFFFFLPFFSRYRRVKYILKETANIFHHFIWPSSFLFSYSCKDQFLGKALNNFWNIPPLTGYFTASSSRFKGGGLVFLVNFVCFFMYVCFLLLVFLEGFFC